jgi:hypothetical protein
MNIHSLLPRRPATVNLGVARAGERHLPGTKTSTDLHRWKAAPRRQSRLRGAKGEIIKPPVINAL